MAAYAFPCQRLHASSRDDPRMTWAGVDRYSFTVKDLHLLSPAGLLAYRSNPSWKGPSQNRTPQPIRYLLRGSMKDSGKTQNFARTRKLVADAGGRC
jgi:hypothetical protein